VVQWRQTRIYSANRTRSLIETINSCRRPAAAATPSPSFINRVASAPLMHSRIAVAMAGQKNGTLVGTPSCEDGDTMQPPVHVIMLKTVQPCPRRRRPSLAARAHGRHVTPPPKPPCRRLYDRHHRRSIVCRHEPPLNDSEEYEQTNPRVHGPPPAVPPRSLKYAKIGRSGAARQTPSVRPPSIASYNAGHTGTI